MKALFGFVFSCAAAMAQPGISAPPVGAFLDSAGVVHSVSGLPGNLLCSPAGLPAGVSFAFFGSAGLLKTDTQVIAFDANFNVTAQFDAPPGPALFASPSLVYYPASGDLVRLDSKQTVALPQHLLAISLLDNSARLSAVMRRGHTLLRVSIDATTGTIESEAPVDVTGPMLIMPAGTLVFLRNGRLNAGDRSVPVDFTVANFELAGASAAAIATNDGRHFVLHLSGGSIELSQIPEVTQ